MPGLDRLRLPRRDEDYFHDGVVALGEAFNRFQGGRVQWSSFAYPSIRGGLLDAIARRRGESLDLSTRAAKNHHQYQSVAEHLIQSGRPADARAIAEATNAPVASVERLLARKEAVSLESEVLGRRFGVTDQYPSDATRIGPYLRALPPLLREAVLAEASGEGKAHAREQLAEARGISEATVRRAAATGREQLQDMAVNGQATQLRQTCRPVSV